MLLKQYGFVSDTASWSGENLKLKLKMTIDDPLVEKKQEALKDTQVAFKKLSKGEAVSSSYD